MTINDCPLCEMAVADHCPGCHERLIECRGTAPNCVLICVCRFCGLEFQDDCECPCLENM